MDTLNSPCEIPKDKNVNQPIQVSYYFIPPSTTALIYTSLFTMKLLTHLPVYKQTKTVTPPPQKI